MPVMKSPYPQTIASLSGHRIVAEADVPIHIPDTVVSEALATGFVYCDDEEVPAPGETEDNVPDEDEDAVDAFEVSLDQAILRVMARGNVRDFKKEGPPKVPVVVAEMDPDQPRPTATQVSEAFERLQENIDLKD